MTAAPTGPTVLVTDDNEGHRRLLEMLLGAYNYRVVATEDGHEALTYLQSATPDLMIFDVEMPFMDGLELCKRVRRLQRLGSVPVVIMTATEREDLHDRARAVGADRVFPKPIRGKNLRGLLQELLRPA